MRSALLVCGHALLFGEDAAGLARPQRTRASSVGTLAVRVGAPEHAELTSATIPPLLLLSDEQEAVKRLLGSHAGTGCACGWKDVNCRGGHVVAIKTRKADGELASVASLPRLEALYLSNSAMTGSLADLSCLPRLKELLLSNTAVTGSLADLSCVPGLMRLFLPNTAVTGSLMDLASLLRLAGLVLSDTAVTGSLADLPHLPQLTQLYLSNTAVTGSLVALLDLTPKLSYTKFPDTLLHSMRGCEKAMYELSTKVDNGNRFFPVYRLFAGKTPRPPTQLRRGVSTYGDRRAYQRVLQALYNVRIPVLWSGFVGGYGSSVNTLRGLAEAAGGYVLYHGDGKDAFSTKLGAQMVDAETEKHCNPGDKREGFAKAFWDVTSEVFVRSWKEGDEKQFFLALNTPVQDFKNTILFKDELPTFQEVYKEELTWRVTALVINHLPLHDPEDEPWKREQNTARGKDVASCKEYLPYFRNFGLRGTCLDCGSDDLAECATKGSNRLASTEF